MALLKKTTLIKLIQKSIHSAIRPNFSNKSNLYPNIFVAYISIKFKHIASFGIVSLSHRGKHKHFSA